MWERQGCSRALYPACDGEARGEVEDRIAPGSRTRAGLLSFAADMDIAKGQLAASTVIQLAIEPAIIHVVGYSEGDHAATASEIIESCQIVHGVIRNCRTDMPDMLYHLRMEHYAKKHPVSKVISILQLRILQTVLIHMPKKCLMILL